MAEGYRLADRARAVIARMKEYEKDLSRREKALLVKAERSEVRPAYPESSVLRDAVRESFKGEPEQEVPVLRVQRKFSPKNLGPDDVKIDYAQNEISLTVNVRSQSDLGYYERALEIVSVPSAYTEIDSRSRRVLIRGKPEVVEDFFKRMETHVQHARSSSEVDNALDKLAQ